MNADFNLFGVLGIRLVNPEEIHIKSISRLTGITPSAINGKPDITITYTDKIDSKNLTFVGLDAGFDYSNFYLLKKNQQLNKVIIPFDKIGNRCEIICEKSITEIPMLNYIINLSFLSKNWIAVHSSSFVYDEKGVLVLGWTKGGKTETLISFLTNGAKFVSDEWTIISEFGKSLYGMPVAICIWEFYFNEVKNILPKISPHKKFVFSLIHFIQSIYKLGVRFGFQNSEAIKIIKRISDRAKKNLNIRVLPKDLINIKIAETAAPLHKVIFSVSSQNNEMTINKISAQEVIERMIQSNREEYSSLFSYYSAFRFAFPDRKNALFEKFDELQKKIFDSCFAGKDIYKVIHPYPAPINKMYSLIVQEFSQKQ